MDSITRPNRIVRISPLSKKKFRKEAATKVRYGYSKNYALRTDRRICNGGANLSEKDTLRVTYALNLWVITWKDTYVQMAQKGLINDDVVRRQCSNARVVKILRGLMHSDLAYIVEQTKCMLLALRHLDEPMRSKTVIDQYLDAYGVQRKGVVWGMLAQMMRDTCCTSDPLIFGYVNTLLQFLHRLTLCEVEGLEEKCVQEYIDFEEKLKTQVYDPNLIDELRSIINEWFAHISFDDLSGVHGYGATSTVKRSAGTDEKYLSMIPSIGTARVRQFLDWQPDNILAWPGLKSRYDACLKNYTDDSMLYGVKYHTAVLLCVPKGIDKKRVISMETVNNQFFQKMLFNAMDRHYQKHPEIGVHLHNQEINRNLASRGSLNENYATIDLSSASDSVTWTLTRQVFRDTPLFYPLVWTRTKEVLLPDGRVLTIEKAYPMGSALCFPIECAVFSACAELARRRAGSLRRYGVYGDDCVIPIEYEQEFLKILEALHFIVNGDKSYLSEQPFKEACGAEIFKGIHVEPMRLPRSFDITKLPKVWISNSRPRQGLKRRARAQWRRRDDGSQLMCMYKLINEAYKGGYTSLYQSLVRLTLDFHPEACASEKEAQGFLVTDIRPWVASIPAKRRRWNESYQRCEVLVEVISSKVTRGTQAYSKCLEDMYYTHRTRLSPETRIEARTGKAITSAKCRWIPLDAIMA